jgi:hypothetical protein
MTVSNVSSDAPVVVKSDVTWETIAARVTVAERAFVEKQSRAELRTVSNYMRSLIIEAMSR